MGDGTENQTPGNAQAKVNAGTTYGPEPLRYRDYLTPAEIDLHFQNNENILKFAEAIDSHLREAALADTVTWDQYTSQYSDPMTGWTPDPLPNPGAAAHAGQWIAAEEAKIAAEIAKVRTEFAALAHALTDGREKYVQAVGWVAAEQQPEAWQYAEGIPAASGGEMIVNKYESTMADYEAMKQGFAYQTTREFWVDFGKAALLFVAEEVATSMVVSPIGAALKRAGKVAHWAYKGLKKLPYAQAIALRYGRLSAKTKGVLDRIRLRTRHVDPADVKKDGKAVDGSKSNQKTKPCPAGTGC